MTASGLRPLDDAEADISESDPPSSQYPMASTGGARPNKGLLVGHGGPGRADASPRSGRSSDAAQALSIDDLDLLAPERHQPLPGKALEQAAHDLADTTQFVRECLVGRVDHAALPGSNAIRF